ncbi:DNA topoisomerase IV subunit A [Candidatus Hecatella orcuttiae]|jgi:DNA topoisomerase-6 subunit A|uniref:DNA topoisomerase IV subunit A n=1 Tax=Candidatus Hecatella orcuttiae TaxID=1935119 RepID=UPI002867E7C4|nr:DNA topoisomerase IV subunit A [Candidatus Hecatella orcuttiae]
MVRKKTESMKDRKKQVLERLKELGENICGQIEKGIFPWLEMPSRSTSNIQYDKKIRQYVLGDKTIKRVTRNVRHIRPFTQLVWLGDMVNMLIRQGKTSTLRDMFYMSQAYEVDFTDQAESDDIVTDLESLIKFAREDFNVFPEERSAIYANLTIEYTVPRYEGKRLNLTVHPDGVIIGPALASAEFIDTDAEMVLCIEKGAMFTRFLEEEVHKKFKAVLIHTAGQAPRATRHIIHRLNRELNLPVYIFCDADPWGMHIAQVIISGSANAAHLRELTTPDAKWAGVWASDIVKYQLPSERLKELDLKRLKELERDPRYREELWQREIQVFYDIKKKAEQEAFSRYGLTKIVEDYLPKRMEEIKSY